MSDLVVTSKSSAQATHALTVKYSAGLPNARAFIGGQLISLIATQADRTRHAEIRPPDPIRKFTITSAFCSYCRGMNEPSSDF